MFLEGILKNKLTRQKGLQHNKLTDSGENNEYFRKARNAKLLPFQDLIFGCSALTSFNFRCTTCKTSTPTLTRESRSTSWTTMAVRSSARCTRRRATSSTTAREACSTRSCCRRSTWWTTGRIATAWSNLARHQQTSQ